MPSWYVLLCHIFLKLSIREKYTIRATFTEIVKELFIKIYKQRYIILVEKIFEHHFNVLKKLVPKREKLR